MNPAFPSRPVPLGVYVQVPFCQSKCTYCNFSTGVFPRTLFEPYVENLCREIGSFPVLYRAAGLAGWQSDPASFLVDTVYVGGGTPSLLDPELLARILAAVASHLPGTWNEATLEADPETVSRAKARAWRQAGFNRISLGVQSFHDAELRQAGRRHRRADIFTAIDCLRAEGIENISFDLISGLPRQTHETWRQSLDELLALAPPHVSIYLLELDEGSHLGRESLARGVRYGVPSLPDDDQMASCYELAIARLAAAGYDHYEISNWARPGYRSRHNLKYWRRQPYLGFGAGAHSFDGGERWANVHDPVAYVAALETGTLSLEERETVAEGQALDEELFLGLRQMEGIDLGALEHRYGASVVERIQPLLSEGALQQRGGRLRLAPDRIVVSNEVFVRLLDGERPGG